MSLRNLVVSPAALLLIVVSMLAQAGASCAAGAAPAKEALTKAVTRLRLLPTPDVINWADSNAAEGMTIAIDGDTAVVGEPRRAFAYIFVRNASNGEWQLQETLAAPSNRTNSSSRFGSAVAISGNRVIVGAPDERVANVQAGSAHVYARNGTTWSHSGTVSPAAPAAGDRFGAAVAIDGDQFAVGAPGDDVAGLADQGSVSLFGPGLFGSFARSDFLAPDGAAGDRYGESVALHNNRIVAIGAPGDDTARGIDAGSVRIVAHTAGGWTSQFALVPTAGAPGDLYGAALDLHTTFAGGEPNYLAVGAPAATIPGGGTQQGLVRVLRFISYGTAADFVEEALILAADRASGDEFGVSVSIDGERLAVGAQGADGDVGAVYVYRKSGDFWTSDLEQRLAETGIDGFGGTVALDGERIAIATDDSAHRIFSYSGANWVRETILSEYDGAAFEQFGRSVSMDGDWLAVGSPHEGMVGNYGRVSLYRRDAAGWVLSQQLDLGDLGEDREVDDLFGYSVALQGSVLVVGTPGRETPLADAGQVDVFRLNEQDWQHETRLVPSDPRPADSFGAAVAIDGTSIVVGAPGATVGPRANQGLAYVFERVGNAWLERRQLIAQPTVAAADGLFGWDVAIDDDRIVVGAPGGGFAEVFERNGDLWPSAALLESGVLNSSFGAALAIDGNVILVGAPGEDTGRGAAYRFSRNATSNTWPSQRFVATDTGAGDGDGFGSAVDLQGQLMVVAAPYRDIPALLFLPERTDAGAVYVSVADTPTSVVQTDRFLPIGGTGPARFGFALDLDGDAVAIGAPVKDNMFMDRGEVVVAAGLVKVFKDSFE